MVTSPTAQRPAVQVGIQGDASGFNQALNSAGQSLSSFRGAVATAGAAVAALGTKMAADAVAAASSFEDAVLDLEKVAGEETAQGLRDNIQTMAEEIPLTAEELAGLATQAARFGVEGEENIEQFTRSTARMATATTLSTDQAAEAFAKLSELTGTPIENVENLGASVNELSNNFATSSQEITEASLRSAGALNQLGLGAESVFGLNAAMNEVSESSRRAGTRLRRLTQEIMQPDAAEDFAEPLGLTAEEFGQMREENPRQLILQLIDAFEEGGESADQLRANLSNVSQQALAGLAQNAEGVREAIQTSNEAFEEGTSLQREFGIESEKTSTQVELLRSEIANIQRQIGDDLLPVATDMLSVLSDGVSAFGELNDATNGTAGTIAVVGSVVGGLAVAVGALIGPLSAAAGAATTAGSALAVLAGPVGIVAAAATALAFIFKDELIAAFGVAAGFVVDEVVPVLEELAEFVTDEVVPPLTEFGELAVEMFEEFAEVAADAFRDLVREARPAIRFVQRSLDAFATLVVTEIVPAFGEVLAAAEEAFGPLAEEIRESEPVLRDLADAAAKAARIYADVWGAVLRDLGPVFDALGRQVSTTVDFIVRTADNAFSVISNAAQLFLNLLQGDFGEAFGNLEAITGAFADQFENLLTFAFDSVLNTAGAWGEAIVNLLGSLVDVVVSWAFPDELIGAVEGAVDAIVSGGGAIIGGLVNGIQGSLNAIAEFVTSAWTFAADLRDTVDGAVQDVIGAAGSATGGILGAFLRGAKVTLQAVTSFVTGVWSFATDLRDTVDGAVQDVVGSASSATGGTLGTFLRGAKITLQAVTDFVRGDWSFRGDIIDTVGRTVSDILGGGERSGLIGGLATGVKDALGGIANFVRNVWSFRDAVFEAVDAAKQAALGIVDGLASSVESAFSGVISGIRRQVNAIIRKVNEIARKTPGTDIQIDTIGGSDSDSGSSGRSREGGDARLGRRAAQAENGATSPTPAAPDPNSQKFAGPGGPATPEDIQEGVEAADGLDTGDVVDAVEDLQDTVERSRPGDEALSLQERDRNSRRVDPF